MRRTILSVSLVALLAVISLIAHFSKPDVSAAGPVVQVHREPAVPVSQDPPGTIDGSKTPELIPDTVAFTLLFRAVAEPENATSQQRARARAKIALAHLAEADIAVFLGEANEFQRQLGLLDDERARIQSLITPGGPTQSQKEQLDRLFSQRRQFVTDSIALFPSKLSSDGRSKVNAFLSYAKGNMKIFPD